MRKLSIWWIAFTAHIVRAIRDEHIGAELDESGGKQRLNFSRSQSNRSFALNEKEETRRVDPLTLGVAVAEQSIMAVLETAIRTKAGGTCPEEIKIPSTPGVQLKPEWLYGVGCQLDNGKLCQCPWTGFYGCHTTGMFGLPGGLTTDIIKKFGFCRIEAWIFIIPPVLLVGASIYFMPCSGSRESGNTRSRKRSEESDD